MMLSVSDNIQWWTTWFSLFDEDNIYEETVPQEQERKETGHSRGVSLKELSSIHKLGN